ncbi:EamA family transporter [Microvirga sp. 2TAF3]|uniref:EamA family transporter n=1 Tax=Microvirga sp. 2TAF3 TaxID=3233014 RepID=UPI003F97F5AD
MEPVVFVAVLAAASMHAGWNALVKVGLDRYSSILLLSLSGAGICLVLLPFFPFPAPAALPWLLTSALIHACYKLTLIKAYEHGDLSQVYPLARGTAPLIVALVGALFLGEVTTLTKVLAILSIGLGVCLMSLKGGVVGRMPPKAFGFALATAACTASYTLIDGIGARLSGSASGFIILLTIADGLFTCAYALATRGPMAFMRLTPAWRSGLTAGGMSLASYWIAVWAFTKAPIALVAALRETSVLFAMLIAILFLKERAGPSRIFAACMIACGVVLMRV